MDRALTSRVGWRISANKGRRVARALAVPLCCLLLATGCKTSDDATAAATQMAITAKTLAAYYSALAEILRHTDRLNVVQEAMLSIPYDDATRKQIADAASEIGKREEMAEALSELAGSFANLADPSSAKAAGDAAVRLQTQLESIKQVASASPEIDGITTAIQLAVKAMQEHKEREAAKGMSSALTNLDELFKKEMRLNNSLEAQYITLAESLATHLVDRGQVDESSFVADALGPFELTPSVTAPDMRAKIDVHLRQEIQFRAQRERARFERASGSMEQALAEMSHRVDLVANDKAMQFRTPPLSVTEVEKWAGQQWTRSTAAQ